MENLFIPENKEQEALAKIIMNDMDKSKRQTALKKLRDILGRNEAVSTIQSKEYYDSIPNKPKYFKKFRSAIIIIFPKDSNIEYNSY